MYCVGEVCLLLNNDNLDDENLPLPLTGKVTATLTKFDIDLIGRHPLVKVCQVCRSWITQLQMVFPDSPEDQSLDFCNKCLKSVQTEYLYWVRACLSDHSGSVECKINSQVCMELLGVPPEEFKMLPMHGRTLLKWKVLLETFDAYFSLYKTQNGSLGMRLLKLDSVRSAHDNWVDTMKKTEKNDLTIFISLILLKLWSVSKIFVCIFLVSAISFGNWVFFKNLSTIYCVKLWNFDWI